MPKNVGVKFCRKFDFRLHFRCHSSFLPGGGVTPAPPESPPTPVCSTYDLCGVFTTIAMGVILYRSYASNIARFLAGEKLLIKLPIWPNFGPKSTSWAPLGLKSTL